MAILIIERAETNKEIDIITIIIITTMGDITNRIHSLDLSADRGRGHGRDHRQETRITITVTDNIGEGQGAQIRTGPQIHRQYHIGIGIEIGTETGIKDREIAGVGIEISLM